MRTAAVRTGNVKPEGFVVTGASDAEQYFAPLTMAAELLRAIPKAALSSRISRSELSLYAVLEPVEPRRVFREDQLQFGSVGSP